MDLLEHSLTPAEKHAVKKFKKPIIGGGVGANIGVAHLGPNVEFADRALHESDSAKRQRTDRSLYRSTLHVSSTSNICERLFRNAMLIMSHLRSHMDPDSLAMLLFLKANK